MRLGLLSSFIRRQLREIRGGGAVCLQYKLELLTRRFGKAIYLLLITPVFLPLLVLVRLMRPWLLVRFGLLETGGIGHLAAPVEVFLCETERGLHDSGKRHVDIWYTDKIVCNRVLLSKWACLLKIWPRKIVRPFSSLNQLLPGGTSHNIPYRYVTDKSTPWQFCDIHNVLDGTHPHIRLTKEEESLCIAALKTMSIEENDPIICFMARDGAFHSKNHLRWHHRDSSVHTIAQAMNDLTALGNKAVRMGAKVADSLRSTNPAIVDYATGGIRTELLDIFLVSRCRFIVSTGSGLESLAPAFRRPVVQVNVAEFGNADLWGSNTIFIPKRFRLIAEKKFLKFSEIFELGAHLFTTTWQYEAAGIEWVDNDVEEIRAVVLEMEQRLSGTWVSEPEDELLQRRFRDLWPVRPAGLKVLRCRIGAEFLRSNRALLQ